MESNSRIHPQNVTTVGLILTSTNKGRELKENRMNNAPKIESTYAAKAEIVFGQRRINSQLMEQVDKNFHNTDHGSRKRTDMESSIIQNDPIKTGKKNAVNKAAEENNERAEVKNIIVPEANDSTLTALTKYYFKSNEGKHSNLPIDVELREATKRALRNAKSEHIRLEAIPMESKKCMLEVEFPSIRTIGRDKNSSHSTITDHGINYNDCVKTLSDSEIELLQNAVISHSNKNNILMMQQVWNQLGEFHQLLEENEASKMEIIRLRNHCTSLEKSQAEKDEKISSLERDFVEMKMELAQYKSMEDFHQMSMSKLETELTRSKEKNQRLDMELLNSSSSSSNNYDAQQDESPKEENMNRRDRRHRSLLTRSYSEKEIGCNVRAPVQPMRNSRSNLLTRSCKWVSGWSNIPEIILKDNVDDPKSLLDIKEDNANEEEQQQRHQPLFFNRRKRSTAFNKANSSSSRESWGWRVGPAAQDASKLNPANIKGHRRSWSADSPAIGGFDHTSKNDHPMNKSFIDPSESQKDNTIVRESWKHIIWDGRSGSGETDIKSDFSRRGGTMPVSNIASIGCTTNANRGDFAGNANNASCNEDIKNFAKTQEIIFPHNKRQDSGWGRISSLTLDTLDPIAVSRNLFQPTSVDLPKKPPSRLKISKSERVVNSNSGFGVSSQRRWALTLHQVDNDEDSSEYSLPKLQNAKSNDVGNTAPLGQIDSSRSGFSLAFC